jgi:hypothetical protein
MQGTAEGHIPTLKETSMHDPMTVAFEIRWPFRDKPTELFPKGYRRSLVTIWHKDPERGGSDDSCGWCYPRLTKKQRDRLQGLAWTEGYSPWFQRSAEKKLEDPVQAECLMRAAVAQVARCMDVKFTWDQIYRLAVDLTHNSIDNARGGLCFRPGYHSNHKEDRKEDREEHAMGLFCSIARNILRELRPWYRHPRWHVWHWRFQIHAYQAFLRWVFTRCDKCGGRFKWGETGLGHGWDSDGPRWFKSERLDHMRCAHGAEVPMANENEGATETKPVSDHL